MVRAGARLALSKDVQVNRVATAGASGDLVDAVADVLDLAGVVPE